MKTNHFKTIGLLLLIANFWEQCFAVPSNAIIPILWPIIAQLAILLTIWWIFIKKFWHLLKPIIPIKTKWKSERLKELSKIVVVPLYYTISRLQDYKKIQNNLDKTKTYIVRSSCKNEDQKNSSYAWQSFSSWPISYDKIQESITKAFAQTNINNVIIQEYIQWESGVIFCLAKDEIIVEYSNISEWVTSWSIIPFVWILPSNIEKYSTIYEESFKIFDKNWACDIEFVWLEKPNFVQVRPITKNFKIDKNLETLKMQIQELPAEEWIENDFCRVLIEREEYDKSFIEKYIESNKKYYQKHFNKNIEITYFPFIKISDQYFISSDYLNILKLNLKEVAIFSSNYEKNKNIIKHRLINNNDLEDMFDLLITLSIAYDLLNDIKIFEQKEFLREKIYSKLEKSQRTSDFTSNRAIDEIISFDYEKKIWKNIWYKNQDWITIVEGDFLSWPYHIYDPQTDFIPENEIIITKELYPNLGKNMKKIKGIICKNWAQTSHVSILAREYNIPLKIQAKKEYEKHLNQK